MRKRSFRRYAAVCLTLAMLGPNGLMPDAARGQNAVPFSVNDPGETKSVAEWGVDTAWPNFDNVRQSIEHIGPNNIDVVRLTFHPGQPLTPAGGGGFELSNTAKGRIDEQLSLASMAGAKPIALLPGELGDNFDAQHWERTIKATQAYINSRPGWTNTPIKSIEAFNEPDFWPGEGSPADLNNLITALKAYPAFQNTAFPAASTLNSDVAQWWFDRVPAATQGSSHLLGGSLTSYVNFIEHVKSTGKAFVNPELHSLGEAIVGAEHGMAGGIWWADALRARGLFAQASDGKRLGYAQDLGGQAAAAVYRAPDGELYGFAGGLERFGQPTNFRFVSTDSDVYFNGLPVREYVVETKPDEFFADGSNDFSRFGSWSNQGSVVDIDLDDSGVPALDGYRWKIVNAQTGQVMEVVNGQASDGGLIRSTGDDGGLNQMWDIVRTRNGYYHLFNANSGRTAEVANLSLNGGADVRQWGTADNAGQQWYIEASGDGAFFIRNAHSNMYMTADGGGGNPNIVQDSLTGALNQQWAFVISNPDPADRLVSEYAFQGGVGDGTGAHPGVAFGNPAFGEGPSGLGQAIALDGADDFVQLPAGVADTRNITLGAWVNWDGGAAWQRIFDFGNDTTSYMFLTPMSGDNTMRFAITTKGNNDEFALDTDPLPTGEWVHLAVTLGGNTAILYVNGVPRVAGQALLNPDDFNPTQNFIGKSQFANDPLFDGMIDDLRVYDWALSPDEVRLLFLDSLSLVGDLDGDGFVGIADLNLVLGSWNGFVRDGHPADPTGDNFVGIEDLNTVLGDWNAGTPPAESASIPEPAGLTMLGLGAAAWIRRRRTA